jgi:hypothetical protein
VRLGFADRFCLIDVAALFVGFGSLPKQSTQLGLFRGRKETCF